MNDVANSDDTDTASFARPAAPPTGRPPLAITFSSTSHPGRVRPNNEDHFLVARWSRSMAVLASNVPPALIPQQFEESGHVFVVADGMGGRAAGEVASRLAIEVAVAIALDRGKWSLRVDDEEGGAIIERVSGFVREVDRLIGERADADPALSGMGTTLTVAVAIGEDLLLFHVGDSRAYCLRAGQLNRLTQDQTVVQEMVDAGILSPEEAANHKLRHMLTQAVGRREGKVEVATDWIRLAPGDTLMLCTDGLSEHLSDSAIEQALVASSAPDDACRALVDQALNGGGRDNVTVVVAQFTGS